MRRGAETSATDFALLTTTPNCVQVDEETLPAGHKCRIKNFTARQIGGRGLRPSSSSPPRPAIYSATGAAGPLSRRNAAAAR